MKPMVKIYAATCTGTMNTAFVARSLGSIFAGACTTAYTMVAIVTEARRAPIAANTITTTSSRLKTGFSLPSDRAGVTVGSDDAGGGGGGGGGGAGSSC